MQMLSLVCAPSIYFFPPSLIIRFHLVFLFKKKKKVSQMLMETVTRFVYFLLLLYAAFQRGHRKEGEWLSFFPSHFPGHELFNGFSHLCVWGDMVCIHSAVTGTTWGSKPMERLLMCKHHINPSLRLPPPPLPPAPLSHTQALMSHLQPKKKKLVFLF